MGVCMTASQNTSNGEQAHDRQPMQAEGVVSEDSVANPIEHTTCEPLQCHEDSEAPRLVLLEPFLEEDEEEIQHLTELIEEQLHASCEQEKVEETGHPAELTGNTLAAVCTDLYEDAISECELDGANDAEEFKDSVSEAEEVWPQLLAAGIQTEC